jgi:hypothetical protein
VGVQGSRGDLHGGAQPHPLTHIKNTNPPSSELALVPPMLGSSQRLLNRDHAATYYSDMPPDAATGRALRRHGDEVARLAGGYYRALGRCDDTMNLGGIKVGGTGGAFCEGRGVGCRRRLPPRGFKEQKRVLLTQERAGRPLWGARRPAAPSTLSKRDESEAINRRPAPPRPAPPRPTPPSARPPLAVYDPFRSHRACGCAR